MHSEWTECLHSSAPSSRHDHRRDGTWNTARTSAWVQYNISRMPYSVGLFAPAMLGGRVVVECSVLQVAIKCTTAERGTSDILWAATVTTEKQFLHLGRTRHSRTTSQQSPHWLQWDTPNSPQNCPLYFDNNHPYLIYMYPSIDWSCSPAQMASASNQLFCHSTHSRPTDGLGEKPVPKLLTLYW